MHFCTLNLHIHWFLYLMVSNLTILEKWKHICSNCFVKCFRKTIFLGRSSYSSILFMPCVSKHCTWLHSRPSFLPCAWCLVAIIALTFITHQSWHQPWSFCRGFFLDMLYLIFYWTETNTKVAAAMTLGLRDLSLYLYSFYKWPWKNKKEYDV